MTADELDDCLVTIHWTPDTLAEVLGCDIWLVKAWLDGREGIPPKAAAWLTTLADAHLVCEMGKPKSLKGKQFKG